MNGIIFCFFFNISSINKCKAMSKRTQEDASEERVTAKSKPMMSLVSRRSEKNSWCGTFHCIRKPDKKVNLLWARKLNSIKRMEKPVVNANSSSYSEWNVGKTSSPQKWNSDELMDDRRRRPVVFAQHTEKFIVENDETDSYTEAESELSFRSRSFLHRVNEWTSAKEAEPIFKRCNKRQRLTLCDMENVCFSTFQASVFTEIFFSDNLHSIKNEEDLTMKQMFDISEKLLTEQSDEMYGIRTINWKTLHWSIYLWWWWGRHQFFAHKRNENPQSNIAWENRLTWFKNSPKYRALDRIDGEPKSFQDSPRCSSATKVQKLLSRLSVQAKKKITGRIIFMSTSNDISWRPKTTR